jgi:D-3-phosphoglycerate dehydrogenase
MIGEIITLARQLGDRNMEMHQGFWNKVSANCYEIRGKTLGIVGYGHIGSQLSVLAEAMGMNVIFYDTQSTMSLGMATQMANLKELLQFSDFVTLHVPETDETKNMIGEQQLSAMKPGSYLINASRGSVVDLAALERYLESGHIAGCAIDVYPREPNSNGPGFLTGLEKYRNVILTPHIGGSTEEAQTAIGIEVSSNLIKYIANGTSIGSVNFPEIDLRSYHTNHKAVRILNVHQNVPGVLKVSIRCFIDVAIESRIVRA